MNYPQVALDFMNHDHAEFVDLRAKLLDLLAADSPSTEVDNLLDKLMSHTVHHFAEEERLMQATNFPPFRMHQSEHDRVLADVSARIELWKQTRDGAALRVWLERDVGEWFENHVSTMDFVTASFIAMKQQAG